MAEFDQMLQGALWREERQRDLLAWHAVHVMSGAGAKTQGGGRITLQGLLGRAPMELIKAGPTGEAEDDPSAPTPSTPVDPMTIHLDQLAKRGFQVKRVQ